MPSATSRSATRGVPAAVLGEAVRDHDDTGGLAVGSHVLTWIRRPRTPTNVSSSGRTPESPSATVTRASLAIRSASTTPKAALWR